MAFVIRQGHVAVLWLLCPVASVVSARLWALVDVKCERTDVVMWLLLSGEVILGKDTILEVKSCFMCSLDASGMCFADVGLPPVINIVYL